MWNGARKWLSPEVLRSCLSSFITRHAKQHRHGWVRRTLLVFCSAQAVAEEEMQADEEKESVQSAGCTTHIGCSAFGSQ